LKFEQQPPLKLPVKRQSAEADQTLHIDMDFSAEPKVAKGLQAWGREGLVPETGVQCLFGPNGRRDRKDRKTGMPEGVLEIFDSGER
jgi:hypothetical protein